MNKSELLVVMGTDSLNIGSMYRCDSFLLLSFLLRLDSFLVSIYGEGYLSFLKASLSPSTGHLRRLCFLLLIGYFSSCQLVLLYLKLVRVLFSLRNYSSVVCIK